MCIHDVLHKTQSVEFEVIPYTAYGSALNIPISCQAGDEFQLEISYTAGGGPGICWLEPAQTAGKVQSHQNCVISDLLFITCGSRYKKNYATQDSNGMCHSMLQCRLPNW